MAKYLFTVLINGPKGYAPIGETTTWRKAALKAALLETGDGGRFVMLSRYARPLAPDFAIYYGVAAIVAGAIAAGDAAPNIDSSCFFHTALERYWDFKGRPIAP